MSFKDMFSSGKSVVVQIEAKLVWHGFYDITRNRWLAVCPPLNLNAVGETWAELQECANEATQLLFEDLLAHDELESFLRKHGWRARGSIPQQPRRALFDVPSKWETADRYEELEYARA